MKLRLLLTILFVLLLSNPLFALTGREIMEKNDALPEAKTAVSDVLMQIHKGERVIEKQFESRSKKFRNNEDKLLISFTRPTRIKLLTHAHEGKNDDQWLRLSSGKIKRIASSDKGKPFVNSHFYYEDIGSRNIDDYAYKLLGEEKAVDSYCYAVEAVKEVGEKVYSKLILYVRKSDYFIVRIDFYRKGNFHKYLENYDIRAVKGILTPFSTTMTRADKKGKTELKILKLEFNRNLRNSTFNKEALR
ncbi:MAG: outer membrane lipoprotein-sorting protein [Deltaproteobacteria bacterium]|nr:outer membrane lipoprotein-sorting protein [Deltaproteobacteria bacterium]MBW2649704.1 outer membrane lipoprotein-sorting protein [Deltaproteobacteria bacterium]